MTDLPGNSSPPSTVSLYTLAQAADLANLQAVTLRKHCLAGRIGRKLGSQWVLTDEDIATARALNHRPGRPRKS